MSSPYVHYFADDGRCWLGMMSSSDVSSAGVGSDSVEPASERTYLISVHRQGQPDQLYKAGHSHGCKVGTFHFADECGNPEMIPGKCFARKRKAVDAEGSAAPADPKPETSVPVKVCQDLGLRRDAFGILWLTADQKPIVNNGCSLEGETQLVDLYTAMCKMMCAHERKELGLK